MAEPNFVATGTIQDSTFVVQDATVPYSGVKAAVGNAAFIIGVAQEWAKLAPIPGAGSQAADAGDPIKVYTIGDICLLQSTSAGWAAGDRLTSDANGNGVTASGTAYYGAVALTTLSGAGKARVLVLNGKNP